MDELSTATPTQTATAGTGSSSSSFGSDFIGGLTSTLGGSSLGNALGTLTPYAAVGAIGQAQAAAGQKEDAAAANEEKSLAQPALTQSENTLGQYNAGVINPTDQAVVNTGIAQGQSTIASAQGLSAIAQNAFSNYNSGNLTAGDQAALDANTAAQKQAVAQQLASAGVTDSTILAAQYQQIDNAALISKQNTLNSYFATGNSAYDSWLQATTEGQAAITQAQTFASNALHQELSDSMSELNMGTAQMNTAIQTQMQTDQEYAAQVSTLYGTLASAYARQMAGNASKSGTGTAAGAAGSAAAAAAKGAASGIGKPVSTAGAVGAGSSSANPYGTGTQDQDDYDSSQAADQLNTSTDVNSDIQGGIIQENMDNLNNIQNDASLNDLDLSGFDDNLGSIASSDVDEIADALED